MLALVLFHSAWSCDVCGCGVGGNYNGVIPQFGKRQFSLRSAHATFYHPDTPENYSGTHRVLFDHNDQVNLTYRNFYGRRLQWTVEVPVKQATRVQENRTITIHGLGDIINWGHYTVMNTGDSTDTPWRHIATVGLGIQVPTGKFMQRDPDKTMLPANFQLGTGSYAWLAQVYYVVRYRNWGGQVSAYSSQYTTNELSYQPGFKDNEQMQMLYWIPLQRKEECKQKNRSLLLVAGISREHRQHDWEYGAPKSQTGGVQYWWNASADFYLGQTVISLYQQSALQSQLPASQPASTWRWGVGMTYVFQ